MSGSGAPQVDVLIATRNRPEALARALASIAGGTVLPGTVIVVDQGSGAPMGPWPSGLRVDHVRQGGSGMARAQNLGVSRSRAGIVAITDDDCRVDPGWLEALVDGFRSDPGTVAVCGRVEAGPVVGDRTEGVALRLSREGATYGHGAMPWFVGSGNNIAVRRSAYAEIGGCDERLGPGTLPRGGADMDLIVRLLHRGSIRYAPGAVVFHDRVTVSEADGRSVPYGQGMGAASVLWLAAGDLAAPRILLEWVIDRARWVSGTARRREVRAMVNELRMLAGTVLGVGQGVYLAARWRRRAPRPTGGP